MGNEREFCAALSNISLALNLGISDPTISSRSVKSPRRNSAMAANNWLPRGERGAQDKKDRSGGIVFPARLFPLKIPERKIEFEKSLPGFILSVLILQRSYQKRNDHKKADRMPRWNRKSVLRCGDQRFWVAVDPDPGIFPCAPTSFLCRFVTLLVTLVVKTRSRKPAVVYSGKKETVELECKSDKMDSTKFSVCWSRQ